MSKQPTIQVAVVGDSSSTKAKTSLLLGLLDDVEVMDEIEAVEPISLDVGRYLIDDLDCKVSTRDDFGKRGKKNKRLKSYHL